MAALLQNQQHTAGGSGYLPQHKFSFLEKKTKQSPPGKAPHRASWGADLPVPRPELGGHASPVLPSPLPGCTFSPNSLQHYPCFCPSFISYCLLQLSCIPGALWVVMGVSHLLRLGSHFGTDRDMASSLLSLVSSPWKAERVWYVVNRKCCAGSSPFIARALPPLC